MSTAPLSAILLRFVTVGASATFIVRMLETGGHAAQFGE